MRCIEVLKVLCLVVSLNSCAARKLDSLLLDDQITYDKFRLGNILVIDAVMMAAPLKLRQDAPVSPGDNLIGRDDLSDIESRKFAEILLEAMHNKLEDIKTELAVTHPRLPADLLKPFRQAMSSGLDIPPDLAETLQKNLLKFPKPFRFLAQLRVEGERFSKRHESGTENKEEATDRKDPQGHTIMQKIPYEFDDYYSSRELDVRLIIVDVKQNKIVYDGVAIERGVNSRRNEHRILNALNVSLDRNADTNFPNIPSRTDVMTNASLRFVGAFPK